MRVLMQLYSYGGIAPATHASIVTELLGCPEGDEIGESMVCDDALISRSRSRGASRFLKDSDADVLVMVDHDLAWAPGDLLALAKKAAETKAPVGGLYPCRAFGRGMSSRIKASGLTFTPGGEQVFEAEFLATGFLAIPRQVLAEMVKRLTRVNPLLGDLRIYECAENIAGKEESSYWSFFQPFAAKDHMAPKGLKSYLSEDWAWSARATACKFPLYIYEKPQLVHYGEYGFTVLDGARSRG